jgi:hypothetical protein
MHERGEIPKRPIEAASMLTMGSSKSDKEAGFNISRAKARDKRKD